MNKVHIFLPAIAVLGFVTQIAAQEHTVRPAHKAVITCYNGKSDSRSNCSTTNFQPDGATFPTGGPMRCGFPGKVSAISWTLVKRDADGDHYDFVRVFPDGEEGAETKKKRIQFNGKRVVVFKDGHQVVVIDPPATNKKSKAEQDGAGQPATAPESKPEGKEKLEPESEGRSH
jgi:hypothetical protein